MPPLPREEGLLARSKGLLATMLAILRTRLELLSTEVEEERQRIGALLWHGLLATLFLGFGLVFLALFLTVLLWDSHRLLALGTSSLVFLLAGAYAASRAARALRTGSTLLSGSLSELHRDIAALEAEGEGKRAP